MYPTNLANLFFQQIRTTEADGNRVHGPVIGVVVDNKDPDKLARVKVKYPSLGGQDTSWWAPMVSLGAGNERGWFFLPELNDEVLVLFEHGDIQRPLVIGAIWNGKDKPSEKNDGSNERMALVSRGGSKITFDDQKGTVCLEDGGGHGVITISKDNKITIESKTGDVCFQAPKGELNIVANEVKSEGKMNYHIESGTGGNNLGASSEVGLKSKLLQVMAPKIDYKPGGVQAPKAGQDDCKDVPDPVGK